MSYVLRFPFKLAPGRDIDGLEQPQEFNSSRGSWILERSGDSFNLKIRNLDSEAASKDYLRLIWSGFNWLLLKERIAIKASLEFGRITYAEDPEMAARNLERTMGISYTGPVDGLGDGDKPITYPSGKAIRVCSVGTPTVLVGTPLARVYGYLKEGMEIRHDNPSINDVKLQLALELFSAFWFEQSGIARFLTLIMALESLFTDTKKHNIALQLLYNWKKETSELKEHYHDTSDEYHALESLERELFFRAGASQRSQLRSLVGGSLLFLGHEQPTELVKQSVKMYDLRSELIHEGKLPEAVLSSAISTTQNLVEQVLEARFRGYLVA